MLGAKQAHELPQPHFRQADARTPSRTLSSRSALFGCLVSLIGLLSIVRILPWFSASEQHTHWQPAAAPHQLEAFNASLARCRALDIPSGPPKDFRSRTISDRFVDGTKAVLIRNATVWTGAENGHEVLHETDIWIEGGLIKKIYPTSSNEGSRTTSDNFTTIDAAGRWLTPGIVDVHVHLGV